jgi:L-threonine-O-3-phosphate decarboxylase
LSHPSHGGNCGWAAAKIGCQPQDVLDFSASINPLGPPPSAIAAIHDHLASLVSYPDPDYWQLRQALGGMHDLDWEWVLPGNGAAELLTWACRELAEWPLTYLPTPSFGDYGRALRAFQAEVHQCSLWPTSHEAGCKLAPIDLKQALGATGSVYPTRDCGLLLNNPHNPTGGLLTVEVILPYLEQFGLVVVDEAFMDFLPPSQQQSLIAWVQHYPNLVVLRSLTKFYSLPGLRLGYAIAHPSRLTRWQQWRDPWPINTLAAAAGCAIVQDLDFQHRTWCWLQATKPEFFKGLAALPGLSPWPGAANFLLVQSAHSVTWLQQQLLERDRILIRDCLSFPELGDAFFRVAIRTQSDNQRLLNGLAQILSTD